MLNHMEDATTGGWTSHMTTPSTNTVKMLNHFTIKMSFSFILPLQSPFLHDLNNPHCHLNCLIIKVSASDPTNSIKFLHHLLVQD